LALSPLELALGSFQGNREEGKEKEGERGERMRRRGRHKIEGVTDMLAYIHLRVKTALYSNMGVIGHSDGRVSFLSSRNE
jgi:hypothetical protein